MSTDGDTCHHSRDGGPHPLLQFAKAVVSFYRAAFWFIEGHKKPPLTRAESDVGATRAAAVATRGHHQQPCIIVTRLPCSALHILQYISRDCMLSVHVPHAPHAMPWPRMTTAQLQIKSNQSTLSTKQPGRYNGEPNSYRTFAGVH